MNLLENYCSDQEYTVSEKNSLFRVDHSICVLHSIDFSKTRLEMELQEESSNEEYNDDSVNLLPMVDDSRMGSIMNRISNGLPVAFGTQTRCFDDDKYGKREYEQYKERERKKRKVNCILLQSLSKEPYIKLKVNKEWCVCRILDLEMSQSGSLSFVYVEVLKGDIEPPYDCIPISMDSLQSVNSADESTILLLSLEQTRDHPILCLEVLKSGKSSSLPSEVQKYFNQRYSLFSRWDEGILYDEEGLFSITPEPLALYIALRCSCDILVDAFAGIGGNTIQSARTCNHVISIDIDPNKLSMLRRNCEVYGVERKVDIICGNSMLLLPTMKADVILLAPPWGGVDYCKKEVFHLNDLPTGLDGRTLFSQARRVTKNIVYLLPRTIDKKELVSLADPGEVVEVEEGRMNGNTKMIIAYFGSLANHSSCKEKWKTIV